MITIHKKLVPAQHGYHTLMLPVGSKILSVGSSGSGSVPLYVQLENTETQSDWINVFVSLTNLRCPEEASAKFLGTCQIDAHVAAHLFQI